MMTDISHGTTQLPEVEVLKPDALVARMKAQNPDIAAGLTDKQMANIVRSSMQALAAVVHQRDEGRLRVPGLGRVVIRQVERENEGQVTRNKRVILRPAQPRA